jgi:hypothetical protein
MTVVATIGELNYYFSAAPRSRAALSYRLPRLHLAENDLRRPPLAGERPHLTPSIPPEVSRRSPVGVLPDIRIGRAVAQLHDNAR